MKILTFIISTRNRSATLEKIINQIANLNINIIIVDDNSCSENKNKNYLISKKFKTNSHEVIIDSTSMLSSLEKLCYHLEEPRVGQSYPNYYISSLASKNLKVVMTRA